MDCWVSPGWVSTSPVWVQGVCGAVPIAPVLPTGQGGRYRRGIPVFDYGQDSSPATMLDREYRAIAIFTQPAATWRAEMSVERSQEWRDMEALLGLGIL